MAQHIRYRFPAFFIPSSPPLYIQYRSNDMMWRKWAVTCPFLLRPSSHHRRYRSIAIEGEKIFWWSQHKIFDWYINTSMIIKMRNQIWFCLVVSLLNKMCRIFFVHVIPNCECKTRHWIRICYYNQRSKGKKLRFFVVISDVMTLEDFRKHHSKATRGCFQNLIKTFNKFQNRNLCSVNWMSGISWNFLENTKWDENGDLSSSPRKLCEDQQIRG